jgi:DNA-binding MarR family transcriptional regulator
MPVQLLDLFPEYRSLDKEQCLTRFIQSLHLPMRGTKADEILRILYLSDTHQQMNELQKKVGLTQYKYYEELARLEGAGFIRRWKDTADKRLTYVQLTPLGEYLMKFKEE